SGPPCPVLTLSQDDVGLAAIVPHKTLRDVRQARTRSEAIGDVAIETADLATLDAALGDLLRLHEQRWQERGEEGVLADAAGRARISLLARRRDLQICLGRGRSRQSRPHLQTAMSEFSKDAFDACPEAVRPALARYLADEISAEVALMQLLLALGDRASLRECLAALPDQPSIRALQNIFLRGEVG